ncbi:DcaP family trimeric outer membrane transporter [Thalassotalea litorea]|uniref:DcaP family trimeric outer membrane transporter n=1 Tax=Thalassotalea litorea TaxID=2020715 RepID=UPI003736AC3B
MKVHSLLSICALVVLSQSALANIALTDAESPVQVSAGGYLKLDMIYDLDGNRNKNQFLMSGISVEGDPDYNSGSYFSMHARESRFNVDVKRNIDGSEQRFHIEMDFYDESSNSPRLRLFYFQKDEFIFGQYWTNITDLNAIPYFIDFAFGEALYGGRRNQIRWTKKLSESLTYAASIEEPTNTNIDNPFNLSGSEQSKIPVLTSRLSYLFDQGHINLAGEVMELYWEGINQTPDDSAMAWVLSLSGRYKLFNEHDARVAITHGDGTAKGVLGLAGRGSGANLTLDGKIDTDRHTTIAVSYTHNFTSVLNSTLGYAWLNVTPSYQRDEADIEKSAIAHLNVLYQYDKHIDMGIEYMLGDRININEKEGRGRRVQAMVRYTF